MDDIERHELSCSAKLARVVLDNCGPLAPSEVAEEAYITPEEARRGLAELERRDVAEAVCGVCQAKEEVYALIDEPNRAEPSV